MKFIIFFKSIIILTVLTKILIKNIVNIFDNEYNSCFSYTYFFFTNFTYKFRFKMIINQNPVEKDRAHNLVQLRILDNHYRNQTSIKLHRS